MEEFFGNPSGGQRTAEIDEAMLLMGEFVAQMTDVDGYLVDQEMRTAMQLEHVELSIPVQMDLLVNEDGTVVIGSSPPLYYADTTILPVFHQLNIKIAVNENPDQYGGIAE